MAAALREPAVPVDQAEKADGQAAGEQRSQADEVRPRASLRGGRTQRRLYRLAGRSQHVPEQEHQDARGGRAEKGFQAQGRVAQPPDGKPQEDGESGECAEQEDLVSGHGL